MDSQPVNEPAGTERLEPLHRFIAPRYWPAWLALGMLRLAIMLPYPSVLAAGRLLGRLFLRLSRRRRAIARRNLELCFQNLDEQTREQLLQCHFEHLGMILMESALAWWASDAKLRSLGKPEGIEHLHEGLDAGRGVILLGAHLGPLDLGGRLLSYFASFKVVYRPLAHPLANEVMRRGRSRFGTEHVRKDDLRAMVRELKRNGIVWFAPDQSHTGANSADVPFFSIPVPTNTATSRLARVSQAAVIPFFSLRKPDGSGYLLKFLPPLTEFPGPDPAGDAARINRLIEGEIRKAPEQYYWIHRRFKGHYESYPVFDHPENPMKAITYSSYGPPEVLQVKEVKKPAPKDDEVLIRVRAAEATKSDCEMRSFKFSVKWFWLPLRIALGVRKPRRQILGGYFSGEVESLGKEVTQFSTGDQVFGAAGLRLGAYGEYVSLPAGYTIVAKPSNMSFTDAAAVPLGGLNALHFMRLAKIQPGDKVLINGAGGSIGAHGVQIAKSMDAEVTAVDSSIKEDLLRRIGADHFIDYTKQSFAAMGRTYDVIFDMVPKSSYAACIKALNPNGRYLSGNPRLSVMLRSFFTTRFSTKTASFAFAAETKEELRSLKEMIEDGKIGSIVDRVYPMEQAADAHRRVETEQRLGAVVIAIGD